MNHIFLTGAVGCGKSTVVDKVIALSGLAVGGFRTGFGADRGEETRSLYLWDAAGAAQFDPQHAVVQFDHGRPRALPGRFDTLGRAYLHTHAPLVIMDECGRLERGAVWFQGAILHALNGGAPILGVVREGLPGWTKAIGEHPDVRIVEVTRENRDGLAEWVAGELKK